jgi:hypothetical protein
MPLQVACIFTGNFVGGGSLDRSLNIVSHADVVAQQYAAAAARVRELEEAGALQARAVAAVEEEERDKVLQQRPHRALIAP